MKEHYEAHLNNFYSYALKLPLTSQQMNLLTTSHAAYDISLPDANHNRMASMLNGDIVTDSESDNAEDYVNLTSVTTEHAKRLIAKKRNYLTLRAQRLKAKVLAKQRFLSRKKGKKLRSACSRSFS